MFPLFRAFQCRCLLVAVGCAVATGCRTTENGNGAGPGGAGGAAAAGAVNVGFLLSMTWSEAKKISPQHLEVPPYYKVAADEIQVLKQDGAGQPQRVRAKGHVYMQVDFREQLTSLGQEAYVESGGELIMRGKPLLRRGSSLVEGLTDLTVFYIKGTRLQVVGRHRLTKQAGGEASFSVMPTWSRSWKDGPNPLLPALSPEDVPKELRMNPLLPPLDGAELPRPMPEEAVKTVPPDTGEAANEGARAQEKGDPGTRK